MITGASLLKHSEENVNFLKNVAVFSLLSPEETAMILHHFDFVEIGGNRTLFREGDKGNELFIIKSGKVRTSISLSGGEEKDIASFTSGDFFGEMSIFDDEPRSATCRTVEKTELVILKGESLFEMIETNPEISIKIMYRMLNITTRRLRDTGEFLSDMVQWGEEARKRTITDELTGVYNRRFLEESFTQIFESARRNSKPLSMVMADLDDFRQINEIYGHEKGDRVILEVVGIFRRHLRDTDILARYGGDEFTVLMPDTDLDAAMEISERIRSDVERLDLLNDPAGVSHSMHRVTASQGLACYPDTADSGESLKESADRALYKAKESGRNRVFCEGIG